MNNSKQFGQVIDGQSRNTKMGVYRINLNILKNTAILATFIIIFFIFGLNIPTYSTAAIVVAFSICLMFGWYSNCLNTNFLIKLSLLSFFTGSYYLILYLYGDVTLRSALTNSILIICAYITGRSINVPSLQGDIYGAILILLSMIAGLIIFTLLSVNISILDKPEMVVVSRQVQSFWDADVLQQATFLGVLSSLGSTLMPALLYVDSIKMNHIYKICFGLIVLSFVLIALYVGTLLQNRLPHFSLLLALLISLFIGRKYLLRLFNRRAISIMIFLIVGLSVFLFTNIIDHIYSFVYNVIYVRFQSEGLDTYRYVSWSYMIGGLFDSPFGGRSVYIGNASYVHNLWLDVAFRAGLIPMLCLIMFHIAQIKSFISIIKSNMTLFVVILLVCVGISFLVSFVGDPTMDSSPLSFAASCFFLGIVNSLAFGSRNYERPSVRTNE